VERVIWSGVAGDVDGSVHLAVMVSWMQRERPRPGVCVTEVAATLLRRAVG